MIKESSYSTPSSTFKWELQHKALYRMFKEKSLTIEVVRRVAVPVCRPAAVTEKSISISEVQLQLVIKSHFSIRLIVIIVIYNYILCMYTYECTYMYVYYNIIYIIICVCIPFACTPCMHTMYVILLYICMHVCMYTVYICMHIYQLHWFLNITAVNVIQQYQTHT